MHRFVCTDVNSLKFGFVNYALYIPYSLNRYVQHDASGDLMEMRCASRVNLPCPFPLTFANRGEWNGEGGGGAVCVTYFYSLPCLSNYVCYANHVRDCVSVCMCVWVWTSFAKINEVMIYMSCCMVPYCKKSPCTFVSWSQLFMKLAVFIHLFIRLFIV